MVLLLLHKEILKYSNSSQLLKCVNAKTVYPGKNIPDTAYLNIK